MVYLICGKPGAGKTHYACTLECELYDPEGPKVKTIDADVFRLRTNNQDFSEGGRARNLIAAAKEARVLEEAGYIVILAFIAPKREWRERMRSYWEESLLVYIPGGEDLWNGLEFEVPTLEELKK